MVFPTRISGDELDDRFQQKQRPRDCQPVMTRDKQRPKEGRVSEMEFSGQNNNSATDATNIGKGVIRSSCSRVSLMV